MSCEVVSWEIFTEEFHIRFIREYDQWGIDRMKLDDVDLKKQVEPEKPKLKAGKVQFSTIQYYFICPLWTHLIFQKADCFEKELEDQRVRMGDSQAKFMCMFSKSNAKVKWFKQRQEIFTVWSQ